MQQCSFFGFLNVTSMWSCCSFVQTTDGNKFSYQSCLTLSQNETFWYVKYWYSDLNTLWTGDTDLHLYITTVQDR